MPAVIKYLPPTDPERNEFSAEVLAERTARQNSYKTALKYYLGDHDAPLTYDPDEDDVDDNVVINLVKMTAERTATFLFPSVPTIELDPESIEPTDEEKWAVEYIEANGGLALLNKWALRGFLAGHTFIQVKPPRTKGKGKKYPRISLLDPLAVTIYWNAEDVDEVVWYEVRSLVGRTVHVYDFVHDLENDTWTIYHHSSLQRKVNDLENVVETVTHQVYADYAGSIDRVSFGNDAWTFIESENHPDVGLPPIIETPHLPHPTGRYGASEATLKDLQDTVNLIASLRNSVSRESGVPVDVILGAGVGDVENKEDIWVVDSPNASVQRLQLKGDLTSMSTMLERMIEIYLSISRVVLLKGEAKDLQRVTNASVRTLFLDQIAKNAVLQASYGHTFRLLILLGLKMSGLSTAGKDFEPTIKFANPLPTDFTELANQLSVVKSMGAVSKRTVATEMGYNWAFESVVIESEREQEMEQQREQLTMVQELTPTPLEGGDKSKPPVGKGDTKPKADK